MAGVRVIDAGTRTTVQDGGFPAARGQGVPFCGALDLDGLRLVNALLGNPALNEAIETVLVPPRLCAEGIRLRIALGPGLSGTARTADGRERSLRPLTATTLAPGEELRLAMPERGLPALLGIGGGLDLPLVLGSRSTCLQAGFGGVEGRALRAGDLLVPRGPEPPAGLPDLALRRPPPRETGPVRVVFGPQPEWFTAEGRARFLDTVWTLSPRCDRMGLRLDGEPLDFAPGRGGDIISDGIAPGAIQVPGNGRPILLLADAQTTGGYPKVATVIRADLSRLATFAPGDGIRFQAVTVAEAERLAQARARALDAAIASIGPALVAPGDLDLGGATLIDGVVDMDRPDHFPGHLYAEDKDDPACD